MASSRLPALTDLSVPALADRIYVVDVSDTTDDASGSSRDADFARVFGTLLPKFAEGRLTLTTGVAVTTADVTGASTLYYTPYVGNRLSVYDGTRWTLAAFSEFSLALSGLTSGKNYDVFVFDNAGTLTLELSAAWTNDTTRADALATQDGVVVKSGNATRRWLGTLRTTGTTTTEDSGGGTTSQVGGKRFLWNAYHRVVRHLTVIDTTDSWSYTSTTVRQANGAAGNKVEYVCGLAGPSLRAQVGCTFNVGSTGGGQIGIGVDSTTAFSGIRNGGFNQGGAGNSIDVPLFGMYGGPMALGYHYLAWLEQGKGTGSSIFTGDNAGDGRQAGLVAWVEA